MRYLAAQIELLSAVSAGVLALRGSGVGFVAGRFLAAAFAVGADFPDPAAIGIALGGLLIFIGLTDARRLLCLLARLNLPGLVGGILLCADDFGAMVCARGVPAAAAMNPSDMGWWLVSGELSVRCS